MKKIRIFVDYRERNKQLIDILRNNKTISLETRKLEAGDFLIEDRLLIERKTLKDFIESIKDGRIFRQAGRLSNSGKINLIICEGISRDIENINIKREAVQGILLCLSLKYRIPIMRTRSPQETVRMMISASRQILNHGLKRISYQYRSQPCKISNKEKRQLFILQGLPGIGPVKAKLLLEKFRSLYAIFTASPSELLRTKGIGNFLAEKIISILHY
jgi:ERCC4-type nuclease